MDYFLQVIAMVVVKCCQMFRLDGKLQWRHPAPAKWDEVRNYNLKTRKKKIR